ncbi:MAG: dihydroorotate dehydrogenase electron transfer subunit, partial [Muribaculaceae bacterium]|nr:dihydroorotate dehydrogenase electron transfer subunit [Muribaculaceae bacterium]
GFVTMAPEMSRCYDRMYVCGPMPMMKAVAAAARESQTPCEVSLENKMACGLGACLCCVEDTVRGHECTCTDGPVFDINDLKW